MRSYPRSEDRYPGFDMPSRTYDRWKSWSALLAVTTVEGFWIDNPSVRTIIVGTLIIGGLIMLISEWEMRRRQRF